MEIPNNIKCIDSYLAEVKKAYIIKQHILSLRNLLSSTKTPLFYALDAHIGAKRTVLPEDTWALIKERKRNGERVVALSKEFNVSEKTIYARCNRFRDIKAQLRCVSAGENAYNITYRGIIIPVYGNSVIRGTNPANILAEVLLLTKPELEPIVLEAIK